MTKPSKFIAITAAPWSTDLEGHGIDYTLFALDEDGRIWARESGDNGWQEV